MVAMVSAASSLLPPPPVALTGPDLVSPSKSKRVRLIKRSVLPLSSLIERRSRSCTGPAGCRFLLPPYRQCGLVTKYPR